MNDGLLEVLLVKKPRSLADLQGVVAALLLNDLSNPCLYSFHASDLRLFSSEEISWTLDGEFGGIKRLKEMKYKDKETGEEARWTKSRMKTL